MIETMLVEERIYLDGREIFLPSEESGWETSKKQTRPFSCSRGDGHVSEILLLQIGAMGVIECYQHVVMNKFKHAPGVAIKRAVDSPQITELTVDVMPIDNVIQIELRNASGIDGYKYSLGIYTEMIGFVGGWCKEEVQESAIKNNFMKHLEGWACSWKEAVEASHDGLEYPYSSLKSWRVGAVLPVNSPSRKNRALMRPPVRPTLHTE